MAFVLFPFQLVLVSPSRGGQRTFLSEHKADIWEVLDWANDGYAYYLAGGDNQPGSRHLFRVAVTASTNSLNQGHPECLSCDKRDHFGLGREECRYHSASLSKNASIFSLTCKGPGVPYTWLCSSQAVSDGDGGQRRALRLYDDNKRAEMILKSVALPTVGLRQVPVSDSAGLPVWVKLYLPPDFDPNKKYPMVVSAYGGPGKL
jgi:dipeptidyl aminopeptidase/acylaminoacyl peptidase